MYFMFAFSQKKSFLIRSMPSSAQTPQATEDYVATSVLAALGLPNTERNRQIALGILKERCPEALTSSQTSGTTQERRPDLHYQTEGNRNKGHTQKSKREREGE